MCEFLKEQFGKVKSNDGTTVVMMACFGGSVECAEVRTVVRDERQYFYYITFTLTIPTLISFFPPVFVV